MLDADDRSFPETLVHELKFFDNPMDFSMDAVTFMV